MHKMPKRPEIATVLFQIQPLDCKADNVIPIGELYKCPPTTEDPMEITLVNCVFTFKDHKEGLSLITFSHVVSDLTCLDISPQTITYDFPPTK